MLSKRARWPNARNKAPWHPRLFDAGVRWFTKLKVPEVEAKRMVAARMWRTFPASRFYSPDNEYGQFGKYSDDFVGSYVYQQLMRKYHHLDVSKRPTKKDILAKRVSGDYWDWARRKMAFPYDGSDDGRRFLRRRERQLQRKKKKKSFREDFMNKLSKRVEAQMIPPGVNRQEYDQTKKEISKLPLTVKNDPAATFLTLKKDKKPTGVGPTQTSAESSNSVGIGANTPTAQLDIASGENMNEKESSEKKNETFDEKELRMNAQAILDKAMIKHANHEITHLHYPEYCALQVIDLIAKQGMKYDQALEKVVKEGFLSPQQRNMTEMALRNYGIEGRTHSLNQQPYFGYIDRDTPIFSEKSKAERKLFEEKMVGLARQERKQRRLEAQKTSEN
jgi:hypothetical protein